MTPSDVQSIVDAIDGLKWAVAVGNSFLFFGMMLILCLKGK